MAELEATRHEVDCHDGLFETTLGILREELGYKKLGKWILEEIVESLGKEGLGYFPNEILDPRCNTEPRQWHKVWVYVRDNSTRARVLDAVLHPNQSNVRSVLDGLAGGDLSALTPDERLKRIQEIVEA
ncbi:hypothetical protein HY68_01515 [Streptomyces sp. AcH 505]|uniref:hypothetical protein n=1 Tax=Streptomyces sp. AcH 505 TaxID=352211 RepID=UPI0005920BA9|nr:hypothetical protein HY68_01515 [Streptomyces sp. AcH 505]